MATPQGELAGAGRVTSRALVIVTILLVLAGLKWSTAATMPLAFAIFLIALCWPIREFLNRYLSSSLSFVGTTIALLVVLALFLGAIYFAAQSVANGLPKYGQDLQNQLEQLRGWLQSHGLPAPQDMVQKQTLGRLAEGVAAGLYTWGGLVLFILALAILGLPAVPQLHCSVERLWDHGDTGRQLLSTTREGAGKVQRYLATATLTSGITGVLSAAFALLVGLDFAFLWGLIAFVLNYIPTIGSVIAVIPPALFALLQFKGVLMPLVVLTGLSVIQIVMGSFVYPTLAGRNLQVMPVVLLFSLGFWGFIWGIPGALLATPLTVTIMIVLREFDSTRWVPELLSIEPDREPRRPALVTRIKAALSPSS
jgi:AI-2 transport protein TqsA